MPDLFFVFSGTARIEGFIDLPGVLSVSEDKLFSKSANQNHGRPGGHRI